MNTFFVRGGYVCFLFEITEITERRGVFFMAFRRFLPSIKMFLLKPRNACRGSRDAACCVNRVCNNHPPLPRLFLAEAVGMKRRRT